MPTTLEATEYVQEHGVVFLPGQGGQRRRRGHLRSGDVPELRAPLLDRSRKWTRSCKGIMVSIFHAIDDAAKRYGHEGNYVMGANIAGFEKVANAMMAQGIV